MRTLLVLLFVCFASLHATTIFDLTQDGCTWGCGAPPYGEITLTQLAPGTVNVDVKLDEGVGFVNTGGPHESLEFNLAGNPAITVSHLTAGFVLDPTAVGAAPFGTFGYSIDLNNNASHPYYGELSFDVNAPGLAESWFATNSKGYSFAADIIGDCGGTGNVAAMGPVSNAPEPGSLMLCGFGLCFVFAWAERKYKGKR